MFVPHDRHTPMAAGATLLLLILLIATPIPINGLKCYKCGDRGDCQRTWKKLKMYDFPDPSDYDVGDERNDINYAECSTHEQCELHFLSQGWRDWSGMFLIRAGCATPQNDLDLDDAGCYSTPWSKTDDKVVKGTRTCYCKGSDYCNHNRLKCYNCGWDYRSDCKIKKSEDEWSHECLIHWKKDADSGFGQALEIFSHWNDTPRPGPCSKVTSKDWDWMTQQECSCSTNLCNKVPRDLQSYLAEVVPRCSVIREDTGISNPYYAEDCPRRTICVSRYRLEGGVHVLKDVGCEPPPIGDDGKVIRNGCNPPDLTSRNPNRSCYCDDVVKRGYAQASCNPLILDCVRCKGDECKEAFRQDPWGCEQYEVIGEAKKYECFVTYDNTVYPPQLEAGCRDMTLKMNQGFNGVDPFCDRKVQKGWIGSKGKRSCRCETYGCNRFEEGLVPKDEDEETETEKNLIPIKRLRGSGRSKFKSDGWTRFIGVMGAFFVLLGI